MPLATAVKHALNSACQKLKEKVQQALEPAAIQLSLPPEVVNILRSPQRADKSILQSLFNCIVGTPKEATLYSAIQYIVTSTNPSVLPGAPLPQGYISPPILHLTYQEARRQHGKKQTKKSQELEDEELVIDDAEGLEEEEAELYESYRAAFVNGVKHPDQIVQTASLASVIPPLPTYDHHLEEAAKKGELSDAQLETIVYANMRFQTTVEGGATAGFFLGDGAGVGKGRQIAALILEHNLTGGKRCLWVSTSTDLRLDAMRDLTDISADHVRVFPDSNSKSLPKGNLDSYIRQGVVFVTYSLLVQGSKEALLETPGGEQPDAANTRLTRGSRLEQIVNWLKGDEKPLIVLDECHKAKNLMVSKGRPTQTGKAILKLQLVLPKAQVLYSSATGASEPNNLAYMARLGSCGYKDMSELVKELNESGLGSLEMFSMGLKATGSYVSRALSYTGAEFQIAKISMDPIFKVIYNRSTEFWHLLYSIIKVLPKEKRTGALFFAAQQRFYRQMLMAAKVPETAKLALKAVEDGMCAVIGLQSTGEASTVQARDVLGDTMDDFVSAPRQLLQSFLDNHFPTTMKPNAMSQRQVDALHARVRVAVEYWRNLLPAEKQVQEDVRRGLQAAGSAAGPEMAESSAAAVARAAPESSDDELEPVEALSLDQVIQRQHEEAKRSGRFIDLTEVDENDEEIKKARVVIKSEILEVAEQEKREVQAAVDKEHKKRRAEVFEAEEQVKEAEELLAKVRVELEECDRQVKGQGQLAGNKRLRKSTAGASKASDSWDIVDNSSEDEEVVVSRPPRRSRAAVFSDSDEDAEPNKKAKAAAAKPKKQASKSIIDLVSSDEDDEVISPVKAPAAAAASPQRSDSDDTKCVVCKGTDRGDKMLLCDACGPNGAHHLDCLEPRLNEVPEGDWFCPKCAATATAPLSQVACTGCRGREGPHTMVTCSQCKTGPCHIDCLTPPLYHVPLTYTCESCKKAAVGRAARGFVSSGRPNRGALLMKEKAAIRRLQQAKDELKAVTDSTGRAARATRRASGGGGAGSSRAAAVIDDSSHVRSVGKSSLSRQLLRVGEEESWRVAQGASTSDDDESDFEDEVAELAPAPDRRPSAGGKTDVKKDVKPNVRQSGEYKHSTKRVEIGEDWEENIDGEPQATEEHPVLNRIRNMLLTVAQSLELPANPLDQLTDLMGGPDMVAEMTGRKGQLVLDDSNGGVKYQQRGQEDAKKDVNIREKARFMNGEKLIAIISEAASTGISLQADKRVRNQRRRCHLTLELPWSADKAIQQFGRSHRSNQTSAPIYRIIVTQCAGEYRFAASAAKRLQSLGALLKGDRRVMGAGQDLKEFDCDNKWGLAALKRTFADIMGSTSVMPGVEVPKLPAALLPPDASHGTSDRAFYDYLKPKLAQVGMLSEVDRGYGPVGYKEEEKVTRKVSTWLNRVLALSLRDQELLFKYFSDTYDVAIQAAKSRGEYDHGITSLQASAVKVVESTAIHTDKSGAKTYHTVLEVDRGVSWAEAVAFRDTFNEEARDEGRQPSTKSGFYVDRRKHGPKGLPYVLLATEHKKVWSSNIRYFRVQRPNISACGRFELQDLERTYQRVNDDRAKEYWNYWFELTGECCLHGFDCVRRQHGETCNFGMRMQRVHLVSGAVLPILKPLYSVAATSGHGRDRDGKKEPPKVIKAKLSDGEVVVGMRVVAEDVRLLQDKLQMGDLDNDAGMDAEAAAATRQ